MSGQGSEKSDMLSYRSARRDISIQGPGRSTMPGKRSERRHISGEGSERGQACQAGGQR